MSINRFPHARSSLMTFAVAAAAGAITIGIFLAVVTLFQSHGRPMERLAAAERACMAHVYQSERQTCMQRWLTDSQALILARQCGGIRGACLGKGGVDE